LHITAKEVTGICSQAANIANSLDSHPVQQYMLVLNCRAFNMQLSIVAQAWLKEKSTNLHIK
jgi:hypothetical protein